MRQRWNLLFLLFAEAVLTVTHAQTSYYKRTFFNPVAPSSTRYYHHNHALVPLAYHDDHDLLPEESKHQESSSKRYSKKIPYRSYGSEEEENSSEHFSASDYSNGSPSFSSKENDSREYTIGTQIRVQHPISITKKPKHFKSSKYTSPSHYKTSSSSYSEHDFSSEGHELRPPPKKHAQKYTSELFDADPFHVVPPPKVTGPTALASTAYNGYSVYEPEESEYDVPAPPPQSRSKSHSRDRFKGVASKKQIEKYLEDQEKLLDDALSLQLLNSAKFQKLLKTKSKEQFDEQQYDEELPPDALPPFRQNFDENITFKSNRPHRRPRGDDLKPRPPKGHISRGPKPKRRFRSALVINV